MTPERNTQAIKLVTRHYWQTMKHDWRVIIPAMLLPGIGNVFVFYGPPLILAKLLARFQNTPNLTASDFLPYVLAFGASYLVGEFLWRLAMNFLNRGDRRGIESLYIQAMDYMLAKDTAFFDNNFAGSLTKKVVSYASNYEPLMDALSQSVISSFVPLLFVVPVLWQFSPWLVVALLGMMSLAICVIVPLIRRRQTMVADRETASNIAAGHVSDVISNIHAVRGFAHEKFEATTHTRQVHDYMNKAQRSWDYANININGMISPLYVLTNVLGLVIALLIGRGGTVGIEAVFVTFSYYALFSRTLWEFNSVYRVIESNITEAAQFTELLLDDPAITDPPRPKRLEVEGGAIHFSGVNFHYEENAKQQLFDNLSIKVRSGEKVGLVGHSGSGKTTFTKLLLRFMDLESGEILIDGQNIAEIKQADLRSAIAYVPQEPLLFHRSLMDNIRYGRHAASDAEVHAAAASANAAEFINELPKGYNTIVGERGVKLSGGQRQRIAIARAMLKDAPILILDEATSALDSGSEKLIQTALWKLMEHKTAVVIAHRLSTIQRLDRIIVLDRGKVVEEGKHQDLLAQKGLYAELWAHQSGRFIEE